jgi:hypothetical protein
MADLSLDKLDSIRFKKIRAAGNVVLTLDGEVLVITIAPKITVSADAPLDPTINDLWFEPI